MGTWIIGTILAVALALVVLFWIGRKKDGKSIMCGGNCSTCKTYGQCDTPKRLEEDRK